VDVARTARQQIFAGGPEGNGSAGWRFSSVIHFARDLRIILAEPESTLSSLSRFAHFANPPTCFSLPL
jgi:hypothetical protein